MTRDRDHRGPEAVRMASARRITRAAGRKSRLQPDRRFFRLSEGRLAEWRILDYVLDENPAL